MQCRFANWGTPVNEYICYCGYTSKHPLLSRDLLTEMGITLDSVKAVTVQQTCVEEKIVKEYDNLFKKKLGSLCDI